MRILLIEDDELVSQALEKILLSQNYVVDIATNGEAGWEFVEAFAYDLIVLDIVLPKLDGIHLCRRLRDSGYQIPVLLLTAQDSSTDKVMGLDAGADDYVVKPFEVTELLARIRVLLRRSSVSTPVTLEWAHLCLDPGLCQVTYRDQLLTLTPKEYRLLELFLRNHYRVFSRSAILDHLWPCEQAPSEDAVTVHIKDLRKKLKQAGAPSNFIETVYGQGYRLKQLEAGLKPTHKLTKIAEVPAQTQEKQVYEQLKTELSIVWERHRSLNQRRLTHLEDVLAKLQSNALEHKQWHEAQQIAHKLAGALGIFGFVEASQLAREIETIFERCEADRVLRKDQIPRLTELLAALKNRLEPSEDYLPMPWLKSQPLKSNGGKYPGNVQILVMIDGDTELVEGTLKLATAQGISIEQIQLSSLSSRKSWTSEIAILNWPLAQAKVQDLKQLVAFANQIPPILVLLLTTQNNWVNQVKVSHLAAHVCLPMPMVPEQVLIAVTKVRSHLRAAVAKVMIVDDDIQVLSNMRTLLEPWNMQVTTLSQTEQFLPVLERCSPDLLVLDLKMPKFNGLQLCQVLRHTPQWNGLPILFLTAHTDVSTAQDIFAAGADGLISKTVGPSELTTRILNTLGRTQLYRMFAVLKSS